MIGPVDLYDCRKLWVAVVVENCNQEIRSQHMRVSKLRKPRRKGWLDTPGFHEVCSYAGIDSEKLKAEVEDRMQKPTLSEALRGFHSFHKHSEASR